MERLYRPELGRPPAPVIDGALERLYRQERARARDRWRHIRDPRIDGILERRAAIAYDTATDGGRATVASQSWSHTCTGSNGALVVGVLNGSVENITGVTYNSVALTQIGSANLNHAGNYKLTAWYLLGPATGANTIQVTANSATDMMPIAASYTGVLQSGFPDAYNGFTQATGSATDTEALTTASAGCWIIWVGLDEFNTSETAGAGTTLRRQSSGYGGVFIADSNGSVGSAGSHNLVMNPTSSGDWMNNMLFSAAPFGGGGGGGVKLGTSRLFFGFGS